MGVAVFLYLLGPTPVGAIMLPATGTVTDLKQHALYRADPAGELSAEELLADDQGFQAYNPAWEERGHPMWIKLPVQQPASHQGSYWLLVKSRYFHRLDVHLPTSDGQYRRINSGTINYEPTKKLGYNYVYQFALPPDAKGHILFYLDIRKRSLSALNFSIMDEQTFGEYSSTSYWAYGLYFGAMVALIFYNLILYLNLRTPGHRLYVTAMVCVIALMGMNSGLLQNVLPDALERHAVVLHLVLNALTAAATARFFQEFVGSRRFIPILHRLVNLVIVANLLVATATVLIPIGHIQQLGFIGQPIGTLTMATLLLASLVAGFRGSGAGYVFLAAWCAFAMGAFIYTLLSFDVIERTPAAEYSLYVGSVMEAMILALGLSYRVGQLRTQRNVAIREQHRAARLANIDSLTGAYNRRFIENYLDGLLDSDERRVFQGSLIMLDLDHFKPVNDDFGHAAGDAVLQEMTRRCLNVLRAEDVLARLGGDEFAIVLPDQSGDQAITVAEKLRNEIARKPVTVGMQPIPISVSIGVLTSFEAGATSYSAFKHADKALYEAKRAGRNRIVTATGGTEASSHD
jgi:diguanylate cyclase (GGDEF)-like protein